MVQVLCEVHLSCSLCCCASLHHRLNHCFVGEQTRTSKPPSSAALLTRAVCSLCNTTDLGGKNALRPPAELRSYAKSMKTAADAARKGKVKSEAQVQCLSRKQAESTSVLVSRQRPRLAAGIPWEAVILLMERIRACYPKTKVWEWRLARQKWSPEFWWGKNWLSVAASLLLSQKTDVDPEKSIDKCAFTQAIRR